MDMRQFEKMADGTLYGTICGTTVTVQTHATDTWMATAWPDDGTASITTKAKTAEQTVRGIAEMLVCRI